MVTWGAGAHRIGRCSGWSRGQVTGWVTCRGWHHRLAYGLMTLRHTCWCLIVFAPLEATVHGVVAGADAWVAACFIVAICPWFYGRVKQISIRICIIILLISSYPLPWYITPWEEQMTSGDVPCFAIRAVQFRQANDHFIFCRVRSRFGRKSWETAARVACAEAHCLGSKLYASKLYQRKAKSFKLSYINWGCPGLKLVVIYWTSIK